MTSTVKPLVIWGASGHALVVADIVRLAGEYRLAGFLDDVNLDRHGAWFCEAPILGGQERLTELRARGVEHLAMGIGDCATRLRLAHVAERNGFIVASALHPKAIIAHSAYVGTGTVMAAGSVVNPGAWVGAHVIINTAATVDHECVVEDGAHISPGAHLAGKARIGRATWVGIGATVLDGVVIGEGAIVGAGAVVVNDIPAGVVAYGVPARVVRRVERNNGEDGDGRDPIRD